MGVNHQVNPIAILINLKKPTPNNLWFSDSFLDPGDIPHVRLNFTRR